MDAPVARVGPRPLGLHLQLAARLGAGRLPGAGIGAYTADPLLQALSGQPARDLAPFLQGVKAYWRHPYRRPVDEPPVLWSAGTSRLLDHGGPDGGMPVMVLPSPINRAYILDLQPRRSFLRHLADQGFRPFLLDWGTPQGAELNLGLADLVLGRAAGALDRVVEATGRQPVLLGYCMGGLLATALAQARAESVVGLALLATPWNFHAEPERVALVLATSLLPLTLLIGTLGFAPVELLQSFFATLDPDQVVTRFRRFGELPPTDPRTELFVAVEDWLNDGAPLPGPVAQECLWHWYAENRTVRGTWAPGGMRVRPENLRLPSLVAIPRHDRIVPAASAEALAVRLQAAVVVRPAAGHVSMVVGDRAPARLWRPLSAWLRTLDREKVPPDRHRRVEKRRRIE